MIQVYLSTTTQDVEGSWDPEDNWDRPDTQGYLDSVYAKHTDSEPDNRSFFFYSDSEIFDIEPDDLGEVHVVIVSYSTGDTFGHDDGIYRIMDAFGSFEEAERLVAALAANEAKGRSGSYVDFSYKHNGKEYSLPWVGYFESLNYIFVESVRVDA